MRILLAAILLPCLFFLVADSGAQQATPKAKTDPKAKADPKKDDAPAPKFNLKLNVADTQFGTLISGPKLVLNDLKGRVVLVDYWGINCAPCLAAMPATESLYSELADFGFVVVGAHVQEGAPRQVELAAKARGATFSISQGTNVVGSVENLTIPHCLLFDHTGICVYRGLPTQVEGLIREAIGKMIVENAGREKFSPSVNPIVQELLKGKPPLTLVPRLTALQTASGDTAAEAKALLVSLLFYGQKKLDDATEKAAQDPVEAFILIEKLPTAYKGTALAKKASDLILKLRKEKAVVSEMGARTALEGIRKLDVDLGAKPNAEDPKLPAFQKDNAPLIKLMKDRLTQMKKSWPDAHATKDALAIGDKFGIEVK